MVFRWLRRRVGYVTETDLDIGYLAQKHDWTPAVITDALQVLQKVRLS